MEGSVKSLIEAEEEAHKIVSQAEKEKTEKVKDAHQVADMILNKKKMEYDSLYREEETLVSNLLVQYLCLSYCHSIDQKFLTCLLRKWQSVKH
jgi:cell division septum initiation protein DivIVA